MADKLEAAMHGGVTWTDAERGALLQVLHDDQCPVPHPVSTKPPCLHALQNEEFSQDLLDALLPHLAARVAEAERVARVAALTEAADDIGTPHLPGEVAIDGESASIVCGFLRDRADAGGSR